MIKKLEAFALHNDRGQSILDGELLSWRKIYPNSKADIFGPVVAYSWFVDGVEIFLDDASSQLSLHELPDASGFIGFERSKPSMPNNCLLFDVYGKERMRLRVPWQLTKAQNPESAKPPTSFALTSEPYINPADGQLGQFGITAWVEHAGMYYFELDYHSGEFLWSREIRD